MTAALTHLDTTEAGPGDDVSSELLNIITHRITQHPRTLQKRIGPSELGHPCPRRIAYKLGGHPENNRDAAWLPTIGTAVHAWLESVFDADNADHEAARGHAERWLVETTVTVGTISGQNITGSADLFDRATGTVIDWKVVGPTTLRKYKAHGPGDQYRTQAHLYGRGFTNAGIDVHRVMIVFLPRNGELSGAHIWSEPYDPAVAQAALDRAVGIAISVDQLGPATYGLLPAVESYCAHCPYLRRGSTDPATGCPGAATDTAPAAPALTITNP